MNITPLNHDSYLTLPSLAPDLQVMWLCFLWFFFDSCVYGKLLQSCPTLMILWTVACQASLSMGFSMQESFMRFSRWEYWRGLPFPPPGDLPNPGIKPLFPASPGIGRQILYCWMIAEAFYWLSMYFISIYLFIYNSLFTVNNFKWRDK